MNRNTKQKQKTLENRLKLALKWRQSTRQQTAMAFEMKCQWTNDEEENKRTNRFDFNCE